MLREEKNLKDSVDTSGITMKDISLPISYTKTNKLITALYMVTDIIDKDEPLRNKLRTLGTGIISDIHASPIGACSKIAEIMSFLDIASAINIISEMNCNILRKEFLQLDRSIRDSSDKVESANKEINLSEFFKNPYPTSPLLRGRSKEGVRQENYKGHMRIGVQKGSTLMKALSDRTAGLSDSNNRNNLEDFKKQRRDDIKETIKINGGNATIKDIKDKAQGSLIECGEKTLQRELVSMVRDGVLHKTGEKRWSRYFLS